MMEKKYQLVAWTKNITDKENARLYMIPSLESEVRASLIDDIARIQIEENKRHGAISTDLAIRALRAYMNMARFEILAGHPGDGIRNLFLAAQYCIWEDSENWVHYDTDLGSYSYFCGKLRNEFIWYCEKALFLARRYGFEHVLEEKESKRTMETYWDQNQEERDLERHLKEMSAWQ